MILEHMTSDEIKLSVRNIVSKFLAPNSYKPYFFGSRVEGTSNERSDIDIGIESLMPLDNLIIGQIKDELEELPILFKIDFMDFNEVTENFKKIALKNIECF
jgi:predicted nucleotidyltransferase